MMLYDIHYYDAKTGRPLAGFDSDTPAHNMQRKVGRGNVARAQNTNGDRHVKWFNEHGEEIAPPAWSLDAETR